MSEIVIIPPWEGESDIYTLGPGASWERSMSHNIVGWQIPGEGNDGMDLWCDADTINVTWTWAQTTGGATENPNTMATRFASYYVTTRSEMDDKKLFTLSMPMGNIMGWVQSLTFSGEGGKGNIVTGRLTFFVRHVV